MSSLSIAILLMPEPKHIRFGGGVSDTVINPIVLGAVLIAGLLICFSSRSRALVAFLTAAILVPTDQVLLIGGAHFPMLRVLVIFGIVRMVREKFSFQSKILGGGWKQLDSAVVVFASFTAVDGILLFPESSALVFQLGNLLSVLGVYFLMRFFIHDMEDLMRAIRALAYVSAVVAVVMAIEQLTGRNPYALLGGANASWYGTVHVRDGKLRATGCFAHPILAGSYGASVLPMFVGLWWKDKKSRGTALLGMVAATVVTLAANSSTCFLGFVGGLVALCMWPLRDKMRPIRWGIALMLIGLHIVMKAPVWQLIARVDLTGGSSSDHRYEILNQCIRHFTEWVLIGTKNYASWGFGLWDLGNQYVFVADTSGLIPLVAFLVMIVLGFKYSGRARRAAQGDKRQQLLIWALGASLFANVVAFFGISYFDQTIVAWYGMLAMMCVVSVRLTVKKTPPAELKTVAKELSYASGPIELLEPEFESALPRPPLTPRWQDESEQKENVGAETGGHSIGSALAGGPRTWDKKIWDDRERT